MPRLLLLLPQLPQDPSSGAARSVRTACEMLAAAGWQVRSLATTATESATPIGAADFLRTLGLEVRKTGMGPAARRADRPVWDGVAPGGIHYLLLDTGAHPFNGWQAAHGAQFDRLFQRELTEHKPDIVFGYGGLDSDVARYRRAQTAGCKVVFGLRNLAYKPCRWLGEMDAVLTCSDYLSRVYRDALDLKSTALPSPFSLDDVVATEPEPIFFTAINPSIEKGACFLARLAEELGTRRPDLPMLFVESRSAGGLVVEAGLAGGFDLRRHDNLMFAPSVARPADIFQATRVLLAPSVGEEAFGRVAAEALLNGVPPIVSDRGGLPEAANGGGFVLPLPASLTLETRVPVDAADVESWLDVMLRLADDPDFYEQACGRARKAGEAFAPERLAPRYVEFFTHVLAQ